jgi:uncharacterized protein (UPF0276 family)
MMQLPKAAGVGLRTPHLDVVISERPVMPWFELLADNWLASGGLDSYVLAQISERYPIALHGVNLSLGSLDPLDFDYLGKIKALISKTGACHYSEHCSFSGVATLRTPDLLPMPYTQEACEHLCNRIQVVEDFLEQTILLENVSGYIECQQSIMTEGEFICQVVQQANCDLLLDVNNLYVNSVNHQFDPISYLQQLPINRIKEIHLAGFERKDGFLLDGHSSPVSNEVWALYKKALALTGPTPTLIEWDNNIPVWSVLMSERNKAQLLLETTQKVHA